MINNNDYRWIALVGNNVLGTFCEFIRPMSRGVEGGLIYKLEVNYPINFRLKTILFAKFGS